MTTPRVLRRCSSQPSRLHRTSSPCRRNDPITYDALSTPRKKGIAPKSQALPTPENSPPPDDIDDFPSDAGADMSSPFSKWRESNVSFESRASKGPSVFGDNYGNQSPQHNSTQLENQLDKLGFQESANPYPTPQTGRRQASEGSDRAHERSRSSSASHASDMFQRLSASPAASDAATELIPESDLANERNRDPDAGSRSASPLRAFVENLTGRIRSASSAPADQRADEPFNARRRHTLSRESSRFPSTLTDFQDGLADRLRTRLAIAQAEQLFVMRDLRASFRQIREAQLSLQGSYQRIFEAELDKQRLEMYKAIWMVVALAALCSIVIYVWWCQVNGPEFAYLRQQRIEKLGLRLRDDV